MTELLPAPDPARTLAESLKTFFDADDVVPGLFGGAVYNGDAPAEAVLPYACFEMVESSRRNTLKPGFGVDQVTVRFYVRAESAEESGRLAAALQGRLLPSGDYTPARLDGLYGRECGRFTNGPESTSLDPERAPYGKDCWATTFPVVWTIAKG